MKRYISTFTGRQVDPLALTPADIDIRDIAHSLALQNRFVGHTRVPYSVAEHCVRVSHLVARHSMLWGLLHDAAEAYLGDVSRPLKHSPEMAAYRDAEAAAMGVICEAFNLSPDEPSEVSWADGVMVAAERRDLSTGGATDDGYTEDFTRDADRFVQTTIEPWDWRGAEAAFLQVYDACTGVAVRCKYVTAA